jgi:hypothetical protein
MDKPFGRMIGPDRGSNTRQEQSRQQHKYCLKKFVISQFPDVHLLAPSDAYGPETEAHLEDVSLSWVPLGLQGLHIRFPL